MPDAQELISGLIMKAIDRLEHAVDKLEGTTRQTARELYKEDQAQAERIQELELGIAHLTNISKNKREWGRDVAIVILAAVIGTALGKI
jgi:hypothetical protein